jgi:GNAT superfamily N-acetyltransferase
LSTLGEDFLNLLFNSDKNYSMPITYQVNPRISVHDLIDILQKSTLGLRRPLADLEAMESMLAHANYYIGAYENGNLVGLARAMTDFVFTTYLADLAVDEKYQHQGIGKELIRILKINIPKAKLILLAAPAAEAYYPKIGMQNHPHCYFIDQEREII